MSDFSLSRPGWQQDRYQIAECNPERRLPCPSAMSSGRFRWKTLDWVKRRKVSCVGAKTRDSDARGNIR